MKWILLLISIFLLATCGKVYYDTNSIEVKHYKIEHASLGKVLDGKKILFLSDLHFRGTGSLQREIVSILNAEKPDLIFIGGDLIGFRGSYEPILSFLSQLKAPLGVFAVLGNTEYSNENGSCILCHEERSKRLKSKPNSVVLRNSSEALEINGKTLTILGTDDPVEKKDNLKATVGKAGLSHPSIVLAHSPEIFEEAANFGIDLVLCGHTHGGQVILTRYLRAIFPLEQSLYFLEGFFQKGKSLMYVSKGVGTSFLPFRLGVKPEVAFFTFSNGTDSTYLPKVTNSPATTVFAGFSAASFVATFNVFGFLSGSKHSKDPGNSTSASNPMSSTNSADSSHSTNLYDFESEADLQRLDWECHKWFELSEENVTSGRYSLKVSLPRGQYPGIDFKGFTPDWSKRGSLKMDIFNPSTEDLIFHIRIDDRKSVDEYADRFDIDFVLKPGMNPLSIPTDSIKTNIHPRQLDLGNIKRLMVFIPNNSKKRELYVDYIRLE